jgi:hypothetical protein
MTESERIVIAVAGRSNVGKTSLIRTILKSPIGEVADRADVTLQVSENHDSLQATFVDTPGIRHAKSYNLFRAIGGNDPNATFTEEIKRDVGADNAAIVAIQKSNVVIYVCDLSVVPDVNFLEELKMVKTIKHEVIGILNQQQKLRKSYDGDDTRVSERVKLWRDALTNQKIDKQVLFDCHYDSYLRVSEIYAGVESLLPVKDKPIFADGVRKFQERERGIRQKSLCYLYSMLQSLTTPSTAPVSQMLPSQHRQKLEEAAIAAIADFKENVEILFSTASGNPNWSLEVLMEHIRLNPRLNKTGRLEAGAKGVTVGGALSYAIGAFVGFCVGGVPMALMCAKAAGAVGAAIGTAGCFISEGDVQQASISDAKVGDFLFNGVVEIWGHSVMGFSRDRRLADSEMREIRSWVQDSYDKSSLLEFSKSLPNRDPFIDAGMELLAELEVRWDAKRQSFLNASGG